MDEQNLKSGFVAGTLVHTDKGLVPIQDIKVGDRVLSSSEQGDGLVREYKRVVHTFKAESEEIWQIGLCCYKDIPNDNVYQDIKEFFYLTAGHPMYLVDSEFNPHKANQWSAASEINPGEVISLNTSEGDKYFEVASVKPVRKIDENIGFCEQQDAPGDMHSFVKFNKDQTYETIGFWNETPANTIFMGDFRTFDNDKNDIELENSLEKNISSEVLKMPIFNIEVEDYHSYFVGELGLWVHDQST